MSQSISHTQIRTSTTPGYIPVDLYRGELAINLADGVLYVGDANGNTISIMLDSVGLIPVATLTASLARVLLALPINLPTLPNQPWLDGRYLALS
jgi:hypothetical protein